MLDVKQFPMTLLIKMALRSCSITVRAMLGGYLLGEQSIICLAMVIKYSLFQVNLYPKTSILIVDQPLMLVRSYSSANYSVTRLVGSYFKQVQKSRLTSRLQVLKHN